MAGPGYRNENAGEMTCRDEFFPEDGFYLVHSEWLLMDLE